MCLCMCVWIEFQEFYLPQIEKDWHETVRTVFFNCFTFDQLACLVVLSEWSPHIQRIVDIWRNLGDINFDQVIARYSIVYCYAPHWKTVIVFEVKLQLCSVNEELRTTLLKHHLLLNSLSLIYYFRARGFFLACVVFISLSPIHSCTAKDQTRSMINM